jgi:peptidoglycan/xylan/chitin deacetylase (PgdA/CDA1 family)
VAPDDSALHRLLSPIGQVAAEHTVGAGVRLPSEGPAVVCSRGTDSFEWLHSNDWNLFVRVGSDRSRTAGQELAQFQTGAGETISARLDTDSGIVSVPFSLEDAYGAYVSESWKSGTRGRQLSSRQLDAYYGLKRLIPQRVRWGARRLLARWQRGNPFPAWPYDDSVATLLRFYVRCLMLAAGVSDMEFRWFWPGVHRAAVILTHDVESADGLRLAIEIADLEEARNVRSSFNIVADWYPVDHGIVRELRERGFELGVHGVHHDRSMFASKDNFDAQLPVAAAWGQELGAVGFRSPATHRRFEWLAELPFEYDCTIPHSDPFEPLPGGCCSPWPFFVGSVVELPYTLPQDHTLFTVLNERSVDLWIRQVCQLERVNGLIQCVTHPDAGYLGDNLKRAVYAEFLDQLLERDGLWITLPRGVARWWRERDAARNSVANRGVARLAGSTVLMGPSGASSSKPSAAP